MKKLRGLVLMVACGSAVLLFAQTPAQAPAQAAATTAAPAVTLTADQIVTRYLNAIGGKDAIRQVKSLVMETTLQVMGNDAPRTVTVVDGVGFRTETDFNGTKIIECLNDKSGWMQSPMAGAPDPTPLPADEYKVDKEQIRVGGPLYDYAARGVKIELVSSDGGVYKLKATTRDGAEFLYAIDGTTFLASSVVSKSSMQGQLVDVTTSFSDYRKTDVGYVLPYTTSLDYGGQVTMTITVKKVELNKTIDPAIFAMPAAPPAAKS